MLDLETASAIVTGGASGLGEATARRLAELGAHVVILDRNEQAGKELATELAGSFCAADVADTEAVEAAVAVATEAAPLRALVNCAGLSRAMRTVDRKGVPFDFKRFEFVIRVNLLGTFNCIRLAAAEMAKQEPLADGERGAIVNTASVAAFDGQVGQAAYSASKGGIVGMTLPIARDLAALGIRINTIAPGLFDTPIYGQGEAAEDMKKNLTKDVVFPDRLGQAAEFASLATELLTNSYINGETIRIDAATRLGPR
ncbi:SDR family NAD(P)-dependent oxidoreductase [Mycobacterium sp. Aquia_216]|uniref:SDR family NAD(P)-dependent oxidoreductase n=1 Tax=Mycobacterium sp. Aquia_216 TaxID=2991729 RepID=UPI00227B4548|nr:SDR family NAD(P)-dependent oxidoreductase [Mycobacterium sp. Aquia_216]WAJ45327.1 SDR family NAD(P)-dependent oxidoreductase [Mycobacterium sp. Aquia_216]